MKPVSNPLARKRRKGERVVEEHTERDYYLYGKKVNKNVYDLQMIYESTQALSTTVIPEFVERIRFMVVRAILKATYKKSVDQNGELFNYVLENLLGKIVPTVDPETGQLVTKYNKEKTNLGNYILVSCYWSVRDYQGHESWCESLVSSSDYLEDYSEAAEAPKNPDIGQLKFISSYSQSNEYIPIVQSILEGTTNAN